jgi:hypothetical protein
MRPDGKKSRSAMNVGSVRKAIVGIVAWVQKPMKVLPKRRERLGPETIVTQSTAATTHDIGIPTEDAPEPGRVVAAGATVSEGLHWLEDGSHVIRSSEFDLMGQGDDLDEAVDDFIGQALDLLWYLNGEIERNEASDYEVRLAGVLGGRLAQAYRRVNEDREAEEKQREPFIALSFGRRHKRQRLNAWLSHRTGNYSQHSNA